MDIADQIYVERLAMMQSGGIALDVFVTDGIRAGGLHEHMPTPPFVGIGPEDREGSGVCTYFSDAASVDAFIDRLQKARDEAFGRGVEIASEESSRH